MTPTDTPALALYLQERVKTWPVPALWHDIARLRAGVSAYRTVEGYRLDPRQWNSRAIYIPTGILEGLMLTRGDYEQPLFKAMTEKRDGVIDWTSTERKVSYVGLLAAWYCRWRLGKGVYRFHPLLWESIITTEMDPKIPVACLYHLPEWAVLVETPPGLFFGDERYPVTGVGLYLDSAYPSTERTYLVTRIYLDGYSTYTRAFMLDGETLGECLEASVQYAHQTAIEYRDRDIMPILSIALYLCARNREINAPEGREFSPPGEGTQVHGKKGLKAVAAGKIQNWHVGWRLGAALEASKQPESKEPEARIAKGTPRKPHVRKAHWHLYWTGKNRDIPRVHWLPPTPVNITRVTDSIVTLKPVPPTE